MKNGKEVRPNGAVIRKTRSPKGHVSYRVQGSSNGPWDYLHNARTYADYHFTPTKPEGEQ